MFSAWRPIALALPLIALLAIIVLFFGIRDDPSSQKVAARLSDTHDVRLIGGDRPATLALPFGYDAAKPILLVVSLHAYGSNAWKHDQYLRLSQATSLEGAAILLPQGLKDADGKRFWNASDWCCDFAQTGVDDVAYLRALIQEAETIITIDRVAVVGHSNGGFMAWRLACEGVPKLVAIASITSIAGASAAEPPVCEGAAPVSALHLHVGADEDELGGLQRRRMAKTTTPALSKRCDAGPRAPGVTSSPLSRSARATSNGTSVEQSCRPIAGKTAARGRASSKSGRSMAATTIPTSMKRSARGSSAG